MFCHIGPAGSAPKKKGKKKSKPAASESPALATKNHTVDRGFLCCTHHEVMIAGFAMLGKEAISNKGWYVLHFLLWDGRKVAQINSRSSQTSCKVHFSHTRNESKEKGCIKKSAEI